LNAAAGGRSRTAGGTYNEARRFNNVGISKRSTTMPTKTQRIIGWTLTVLVGIFLIVVSGVPKFIDFPNKAELMGKLQIPLDLLPTLGVVEISVAVLYLIPRTAFLGAILTTGYLGGALWTHLRVGDTWFFPIIIGALMWLGLAFRHPVIFRLLLGQESLAPTMNDAAQR
jgi:hypothetical protein